MNWKCPACGNDENLDESLHCICGHEIKESEIKARLVAKQDAQYSSETGSGTEQKDSSLLNSKLKQFVFLAIFTVCLIYILSESDVGEYDRIVGIVIKYTFPSFIILMGIKNIRLRNTKNIFAMTTLKDAVLCTAVTSLFIPTMNRVTPPTTDVTVRGRITDIKQGRGAYVVVEIRQADGEVITLSAQERRVKTVTINQDIEWKLKRGGLGLLYGPRE